MKHNLLVFFLSLSSLCFAQNKNLEYKRAIKIYNLSTYQKTTSTSVDSVFTYNSYAKDLQILCPTIAFSWKAKNQNVNEIELTALLVRKGSTNNTSQKTSSNLTPGVISGADVFSSAISLRYEYIINFFKNSNCILVPSLGCAIGSYYNQVKQNPHTTEAFSSSDKTFGVKGFIVPRLIYYYSSKCFFDLNIPLAIFDANQKYLTVRNPAIPVRSQRISGSNFDFIPKQFSLRLGFGIKL